MSSETFKTIFQIGLALMIIGGLGYYYNGWFAWLGNLPGDIRIERENFGFYFPITTMIVISLIVSLLLRLFG